ncbi:MAG: CPBP family intramembrane glutamic endopeptidase [Terracidiphilus sp.]
MDGRLMITPVNVIAALLTLMPLLVAALFPQRVAGCVLRLPIWAQILCPAALSIPYILVTVVAGQFRWGWFALYTALPVAVAALLYQAAVADPDQHGNWRDFLILATLGLAVDLRWFESAWPPHLAIFSKMLLLDAGIYGFIALRQLEGSGFDLRLRLRDVGIGLREMTLYTPFALALGLGLSFLHLHAEWPGVAPIAGAWIFTFFFIAIPEELYFRGWMQNLLERRIGRMPALFLTAALFGLSHFNKRAAFFNWRYVLLATLAGVFYGRAWRENRRVGAPAITHATVDTIWSLWLR